MNEAFEIEEATPDDRLDVLRVLDAAMLETDAARVADRIDASDAFVARFEHTNAVVGAVIATRPEASEESGGTLHVDTVAVRRTRRGCGVGSALVESVIDRGRADPGIDRVTTAFDGSLGGFYAALGFDIEPGRASGGNESRPGDRMRGVVSLGEDIGAEPR